MIKMDNESMALYDNTMNGAPSGRNCAGTSTSNNRSFVAVIRLLAGRQSSLRFRQTAVSIRRELQDKWLPACMDRWNPITPGHFLFKRTCQTNQCAFLSKPGHELYPYRQT